MTPDEAKRLGLEQVGWWYHDDTEGQLAWSSNIARPPWWQGASNPQPAYRVADPAALVEALAERDALRADFDHVYADADRHANAVIHAEIERDALRTEVERLREALLDIVVVTRGEIRNIAAAALSATQETPDG